MADTPASLKPIKPYLERGQELKARDPVVAYHCRLFALQEGMAMRAKVPKSDMGFILGLMDELEKEKASLGDTDDPQVQVSRRPIAPSSVRARRRTSAALLVRRWRTLRKTSSRRQTTWTAAARATSGRPRHSWRRRTSWRCGPACLHACPPARAPRCVALALLSSMRGGPSPWRAQACKQFGELADDLAEKIKYAKWRCALADPRPARRQRLRAADLTPAPPSLTPPPCSPRCPRFVEIAKATKERRAPAPPRGMEEAATSSREEEPGMTLPPAAPAAPPEPAAHPDPSAPADYPPYMGLPPAPPAGGDGPAVPSDYPPYMGLPAAPPVMPPAPPAHAVVPPGYGQIPSPPPATGQPSPPMTLQRVPGYKPQRPQMLEAVTLCKSAISALQFQDSESAVHQLNEALILLTQPPMPTASGKQ